MEITTSSIEKYIEPLNINGMAGRILYAHKNRSKNEYLIIYDRLQSIESQLQLINKYLKLGSVTVADLPGYGGMDSLYSIGDEPSLEFLSDYLATLIKLRFKNKKLTLVGVGYGTSIATRTLQKYPSIRSKTNKIISIGGYVSSKSWNKSKLHKNLLAQASHAFSGGVLSVIWSILFTNRISLRIYYSLYKKYSGDKLNSAIDSWHKVDRRTHLRTMVTIYTFDLTKYKVNKKIEFTPRDDLSEKILHEDISKIYSEVHRLNSKLLKHN